MKIVIAGAGEMGFFLAKKLSYEKHDLVIIENDPDKCEQIKNQLDVAVIQGSASSQEVLREAELKSADIFVGVTGVEEVNVLACLIADKMVVGIKVARVKNHDLLGSDSLVKPEELGIDLVIHPEQEAVEAINRLLIGLYLIFYIAGLLAMACLGLDLPSSVGAVAATLGNVGPGLGTVGAVENYFLVPAAGKWILSTLMMAGRLELLPIAALFNRHFWH